MIKKISLYILLVVLIAFILPFCCFSPSQTSANIQTSSEPAISSNYTSNQGFSIHNYNIDIVVGENNVFHITEVIDCCFFKENKHGIYRDIPLINNVDREDGTKNTYLASISNIKVDNIYSKSTVNNMMRLKIGDPNKYVNVLESQVYTINYDYNLGKDRITSYDELYFNIIGTNWDVVIYNVYFTIQMPKSFDENLIGFSSGFKGSTSNNVTYSVNGNTISGKTNTKLNPKEALTIRLQLPENYFVGEGNLADTFLTLGFAIPLVLVIVTLLIFLISYYRNRHPKTVEFYPPENLNSIDIALIYKGKISNKDLISLIVSLASKGYITIKGSKNFTITKIKEYDGDNYQEKEFLNSLFKDSETNNVTLDNLPNNSFVKDLSKITEITNKKSYKAKYFDVKLSFFPIIIFFLFALALIIPGLILVYINWTMFLIYLFPITIFPLLFYNSSPNTTTIIIIFSIFFVCFPLALIFYQIANFGTLFIISNIIGVICSIAIFLLTFKIHFRNKLGGKLYAQILGFKNFIKTAEKARLEALCEENPSYFYKILPYAYVLGVSNVWIKKFEDIVIEKPVWYTSKTLNPYHYCTNLFTSAKKASTKSYNSSISGGSSGGSFSGGGFSGGGFGGGGGGSW